MMGMTVRRRDVLTLAIGAFAGQLPALLVQAQPSVRRVGLLLGYAAPLTPTAVEYLSSCLEGLREEGWVDGRNLQMVARFSGGDLSEIDALAREIVVNPDVVVTGGTPATAAMVGLTQSIPIVFAPVTDPIFAGFVSNLPRPDGNVTGFSDYQGGIGGKWFDLLTQIAPGVRRIGVMFNPDAGRYGQLYLGDIEAAAAGRGIEIAPLVVRSDEEIRTAIARLAAMPDAGFIAPTNSFIQGRQALVIAEIARHRLPAVHPFPNWAESGGLVAYGVPQSGLADLVRRAGAYAGLILNGARVAELPVQQPTKFELVINVKTATEQGFTIPPTLLAIADRVIE
jgi:putative ABC transport system substrate-binding protein